MFDTLLESCVIMLCNAVYQVLITSIGGCRWVIMLPYPRQLFPALPIATCSRQCHGILFSQEENSQPISTCDTSLESDIILVSNTVYSNLISCLEACQSSNTLGYPHHSHVGFKSHVTHVGHSIM